MGRDLWLAPVLMQKVSSIFIPRLENGSHALWTSKRQLRGQPTALRWVVW